MEVYPYTSHCCIYLMCAGKKRFIPRVWQQEKVILLFSKDNNNCDNCGGIIQIDAACKLYAGILIID